MGASGETSVCLRDKCCGKVHNELFQLCLQFSSQAWVQLKTEHVKCQNRKKHTRPFVMPWGIPAIFITRDTKLDKHTEVRTSKHSSTLFAGRLPEKGLFSFQMSPRVWDSLRCWHVEWDLDELLLKAVSLVRLVARIKECLTTAGETNQLSHNVGTIHFWILMHVVHTYVLIHSLSAVSSVHGMWGCATSAVLEVTFSVVL